MTREGLLNTTNQPTPNEFLFFSFLQVSNLDFDIGIRIILFFYFIILLWVVNVMSTWIIRHRSKAFLHIIVYCWVFLSLSLSLSLSLATDHELLAIVCHLAVGGIQYATTRHEIIVWKRTIWQQKRKFLNSGHWKKNVHCVFCLCNNSERIELPQQMHRQRDFIPIVLIN